jgi:hypothetical protein
MALLRSVKLILARRHQRWPSVEPVRISANRARFSSTVASRRDEATPFMRSSRICARGAIEQCNSKEVTEPAHLFLKRVVAVGVALFDQLQRKVVNLFEVVRGVGDRVAADPEQLEVLLDRLFELGLCSRSSIYPL